MGKTVRSIILLSFIVISPFIIRAQPTARFSVVGTHSGCSSVIAHFSDSSTGNPVRWHWVFDNLLPSDTSNLQYPNSWPYTVPGHYNVTLVVYDALGRSNSSTINDAVYIANQPAVHFTASDTLLSCPPQTITFTNHSDTGGCTPYYTWYIDTATIHTTNASYTFTHSGNYRVTLVETDTCGCSGSYIDSTSVKINTAPAVCYNATDTAICTPPHNVCFTNCTSGAISYLWHFGDGGSDTALNPCHNYTYAGSFTDTLIASAANHCSAMLTKPGYIQVNNFVPSYYSTPASPVCAKTPMIFHDTTEGATFHHWHFSSAVSDTSDIAIVAHIYSVAGIYTIKDSIWSNAGCHGVTTSSVVVNALPVITSFSVSSVYRCTPNDTVSFTSIASSAAGIALKMWNFGDTGTYNLAYSDSVHIYTRARSFTPVLTVTDNNGCTAKDSVINDIKIQAPVGFIGVAKDSGCIPFTVHYTTSVTPAVPYFTDSVNFGDGSYGTTDTGSHIYTTPGQFTIRYYYHLATGCSYNDTIRVSAGLHAVYAPTISPDSVCQKTLVTFKGNCTTCTHETWNTAIATVHTDSTTAKYTTVGVQPIMFVANSGGCVDTLKDTVFVYQPKAIFSYTVPSCGSPLSYSFINTSTGTNVFYWNFGDTDTSTAANPAHTFSANGTYSVTLAAFDTTGHGCIDTALVVIHILPVTGTFSVNSAIACKLQPLHFTGPAGYSKYTWSYGDGSGSTLTTPAATHAYSTTGAFTVSLIVTSAAGCSNPPIVDTNYIRIVAPSGGIAATPVIGDSVMGCAPLTVNFHDADTAYSGGHIRIRHWIWNEGAAYGITDTAINVSHTYTTGVYYAIVIDTDNIGCALRDTIKISSVKPSAYFTSLDTIACADVQISFTDTNTYVNYTWYFGDGTDTFTTTQNVSHTYTANGIYTDTVVVVTIPGGGFPAGCRDTAIRVNYVNISSSSINVGFTFNDTPFVPCPPLYLKVTGPSDHNYYQWKFGLDDHTVNSTAVDPDLFTYTYPGTYTVTLIDSNALGCKDSIKKVATVLGPTAKITISPDTLCPGLTTYLHVSNTGTEALDTPFYWSLPPYGSVNTDTPGISIVYSEIGNWHPFVVIHNGDCRVTVNASDSIQVFPPEISITEPLLSKCKYASVPLSVSGINDYTWVPAYGLSCTSCANPSASPTVTTTYTVTGRNDHTCSNTATVTVLVDVPPVITITGTDHVCKGLPDTLSASGISGPYTWLPTDSVSCAACDTVDILPMVSQLYTFFANDTTGCPDSATFAVIVDTLPVISVTPADTSICIGSSAIMSGTGATVYNWLPLAGLSCTNCIVDTLSPMSSTTYTITGTDANGCKDTITAIVKVDEPQFLGTIAGTSILCIGATETLTDTIAGGVWSSSNTAKATVDTSGIVTGISTGTDTIKYTFNNSCGTVYTGITLIVDSGLEAHITTHSFPDACSKTLYQNFGADEAQPAGVLYTWSADNAAIFAVGADKQYCLVNFPSAGTGIVKLTAELPGATCKSTDSFMVNVGIGSSPSPQVIFYAPNEMVCMDNTADSYQWGYDDDVTLDSTLIPGAVNQDYFIPDPDVSNKFYWVITMHGECLQKSYYNLPTGVAQTAAAGTMQILLFPNPADDKINIEVRGADKPGAIEFKLFDMAGNGIYKNAITGGAGSIDLSKLPAGIYLVMFSKDGVVLGSKTFVKN